MLGEINEKGCDYGGDMDSFFNSVKIETEKVIDTYYSPITEHPSSCNNTFREVSLFATDKGCGGFEKGKDKIRGR